MHPVLHSASFMLSKATSGHKQTCQRVQKGILFRSSVLTDTPLDVAERWYFTYKQEVWGVVILHVFVEFI